MQKNAARYAKKPATAIYASQEHDRDTIIVEVCEDQFAGEWDGDEPLDPEKEWQAYAIRIVRVCGHCEEESHVDSMSGIWASDDDEGKFYINNTVGDMLAEHDENIDIDDVAIIYV